MRYENVSVLSYEVAVVKPRYGLGRQRKGMQPHTDFGWKTINVNLENC